ncbi:hypothetical protein D0Y65_053952 [Glycine soja]|uniref:Uncharacterized protein n=1 Tax=Glycine soja TaxID=3848 RepID=A0A445F4D1_GLYSO|nr:hypothetical protein D0Y65_053952 [Glycine soja]
MDFVLVTVFPAHTTLVSKIKTKRNKQLRSFCVLCISVGTGQKVTVLHCLGLDDVTGMEILVVDAHPPRRISPSSKLSQIRTIAFMNVYESIAYNGPLLFGFRVLSFCSEARPLFSSSPSKNCISIIREVNGVFRTLKSSGPSPGVGHRLKNLQNLGGMKDSGPSPGQGH